MIQHENYRLEFINRKNQKTAIQALSGLYYFNDGIHTTLYSDNTIEVNDISILQEIEYILRCAGVKKYNISLNYTIGL